MWIGPLCVKNGELLADLVEMSVTKIFLSTSFQFTEFIVKAQPLA